MKRLAKGLRLGFAAMALTFSTLLGGGAAFAQSIKVLMSTEFADLDPAEAQGEQSMVMYHVYCRLYTFDDNMNPVPDLVASETISPDQRTWTLKLRSGAKFHDGTPVDAEAVKYTIERMLRQTGSGRLLFTPIVDVKVVDDDTVALTTAAPFPALRANLASPNAGLISPAADKRLGNRFGVEPVSCGPYAFKSWTRGSNITLERFDGFYGPRPPYSEIVFDFVPDVSTRLFMMMRHEGDVGLRFGPVEAEQLKAGKVDVKEINGRTILYQLNEATAPTNDLRVREAINYAVDKEAIIKNVLHGGGTVAHSVLSSDTFAAKPIGTYEYNPDKAKELLKEAGVKDPKLTLYSTQHRYFNDDLVAQAIAGYLRAVGFQVDVNLFGDWASYVDRVGKLDFNLYTLSWGSSTGDPDRVLEALFDSKRAGKTWNFGAFADPAIDKMINEGSSTVDDGKRKAIYGEIQEKLFADAPWLFMYRTVSYMALSDKIGTMHVLEGPEFPYLFDIPH
jgi:peptide/nickel transport system substrate-binding protein